jgi:hypothetical protein
MSIGSSQLTRRSGMRSENGDMHESVTDEMEGLLTDDPVIGS